ncbi:nuclear GTP-binding protein [Kwoniella mangroviensis CBS 8886]|nr:nuclear GTP-binding protein [Kwoniella mangroviensis CBS 8886]
MPRIRKQTSNRKTTRDRAKIHKKSVDNKRKTKKAAKKDQTWKSKKKQDPGIPNSFPFKDQILAELAEERRKAEEEKIARREAAKAAKLAPPQEEAEGDTPGIISLSGAVLSRTAPLSAIAEPSTSSLVAADVPDLIDTALATLTDVIDRADVICEVVDARDILGGRSGHVEGLVKEAEGRVVLLVNKIDLVPKEALESWLAKLDIPAFLFKSSLPSPPTSSASSSKTPSSSSLSLHSVLGKDEFFKAIKQWSSEKQSKSNSKSKSKSGSKSKFKEPVEPLVIAFMGLPSVGKTSILNSLLSPKQPKHAVAPYIPTATSAKIPEPKTKVPVEVEIEVDGEKIRVIDTPGWEYAEDDDSEDEDEDDEDEEEEEVNPEKWDALEARLAGDLLRRNLGRVDKVKDVFPLVNYIIKRSNHQDLMLAYNVPFFEAGDVEAFLTGVARAQGRIKKHGTPDLEAAARVILRDWAFNTFPYYTTAPKSLSATKIEYDMSSVLEKCKSKRDLKKENPKGLVRFKGPEEVDKHDIILDDDYTAMAGPSDDEEDEEDDEDGDEDEDDEDEEEGDEGLLIGSDEGEELELEDGPEPSSGSDPEEDDEDEEEEEEEEESEPEPEPVAAKKRKRASLPAPSKKVKRVSFAKEEKPLKGILKRKRI